MSAVAEAPVEPRVDTCWYVYGVVPAEPPALDPSGWPSVGGAGEVTVVREGSLAAVASPVPSADFDHPGIDARLQEPAWLEAKVRAHEQVLELVLARSPVLPFRFCTVYRSRDAVRRFLAEHRGGLDEALGRVAGRVERGVKIFCDRRRLAAAQTAVEPDAAERGGRAYLERRLAEQQSAKEVERVALDAVERCHAKLRAVADDATVLRVQTREQSGRADDMVLNAAYLVPAESRALERALAELSSEYESSGLSFELTGPWPPYSFVPREIG